uniref:NS3 n=1 Tax=uncultured densovirus TaxID=748192 RepID=A0A7L7YQH5_9VIRU|nr:NS3 [uncultured densovirus]
MNCLYGKDPCLCSKCAHCGLCTNGSQLHRNCIDLMAEDEEVSELMAESDESLFAENEENEQVQRNTPVNIEDVQMETFENNLLFEQSYQFEVCQTDVDIAFENLTSAYPDEDFDGDTFQGLVIHKYLTSEMTKFEFFIAHNQWGNKVAHYPKNIPVKMRKGIVLRFNDISKHYDVYHTSCIDTDSSGFMAGGFSKGLLTTEARNIDEYIDLIIESPEMYFCKYCEHYMFDCIEHYSGKAWEIPSVDIWPSCNNEVQSAFGNFDNEETYYTLHAHKLIAVVSPQEPPWKKVCRRLFANE